MRAPARPVRAVFLDDGGVITDNERRGAQWRRLLGEFLAPRLGGTPAAWAAANRVIFEEQWARWLEFKASARDHAVTEGWWRADNRRWLADMCARVGVKIPDDVDGTVQDAQRYVTPRVRAAFTEVPDAIRALATRVALHTASGENAEMLDATLAGMGVRGLFGRRLYGPDLVGVDKVGPAYYRAILTDSGVDPADAIVVDDSVEALDWAREVGMRTVLMDRSDAGEQGHPRVAGLDELGLHIGV